MAWRQREGDGLLRFDDAIELGFDGDTHGPDTGRKMRHAGQRRIIDPGHGCSRDRIVDGEGFDAAGAEDGEPGGFPLRLISSSDGNTQSHHTGAGECAAGGLGIRLAWRRLDFLWIETEQVFLVIRDPIAVEST